MSNFRSKAFNPASKRVEVAEYCDNYYGQHRYGIRFDDGCVHPEAECGIDAAATQLDSLLKERDALQARVKELERDLVLWSFQALKKFEREEGWMARALRAEQERDEAYERAAKEAESHCYGSTGRAIGKRIRRLAGPEKEKKE